MSAANTGDLPRQAPDPITITVGILAFNEERHLADTCVAVFEAMAITGIRASVIIIDDGSSDGTSQVMDDLCRQYGNVRGFRHSNNRGIGAGARSIVAHADGDYVMVVPGDHSYGVESIAKGLPKLGPVPSWWAKGIVARSHCFDTSFGSLCAPPPHCGRRAHRLTQVD